ncbi:MAG: hypothetical protein ABEH56_03350 [Salinirussus sp.]
MRPTTGGRGQTTQDYLIGILVFIAVVTVVVGLLPSFTEPFEDETGGESTARADRVAQQIVSNLSAVDQPNLVNSSRLMDVLELDEEALRDRYGLGTANANVTVETLDGDTYVTNASGTPFVSREGYAGENAATTARIVRLTNETTGCSPACRLVVRIW